MSAQKKYQVQYSSMAFITVGFEFEGFHKYPDAPDVVSFLRHPHRHMFKVRVDIQVFHDDRELEFIMVKHFLEGVVKDSDLNNMSCEMLCDVFHEAIVKEYGLCEVKYEIEDRRSIHVEVSEDGENGAYKVYHPHNYVIEE